MTEVPVVMKEYIGDNDALLSAKETELLSLLISAGQKHLLSDWPALGQDDPEKRRLIDQLMTLEATTPGGLVSYIERAKHLLKASKEGENALEGYKPKVPEGSTLNCRSEEFAQLEELGLKEAGKTAFVLVAGGLGERLGYSGIKIALPSESARSVCFLQLYIEYILSLQHRGNADSPLPFAIMTSGDTHQKTIELLEQNRYFGMSPEQVQLIKQDKVPCLADNNASLALNSSDKYNLLTKPHGHGDVHTLLHSSGLVSEWASKGLKWVCFFQDTNGLVFRAIPAALAISAKRDYAVNSLAVPRKAKEAIGAICTLEKENEGKSITQNVEYNQLDPLLRSTVNPEGDVNDPETGYSPYPGNINQLIFSIPQYDKQLKVTKGHVPEFVNPKYKDSSKMQFKSPTRLECMMQDYPRTLTGNEKVGFTLLEVWTAYSPVKNSPAEALAKFKSGNPSHSATTGELDVYNANCRMLKYFGAKIGDPKMETYNGIDVQLWPRIVWSPAFVSIADDIPKKVGCKDVSISQNSTLIVDGENIKIESLSLDGTLIVEATRDAHVTIRNLSVENSGWEWQAIDSNMEGSEEEKMRGFKVVRHSSRKLSFNEPGTYVVES